PEVLLRPRWHSEIRCPSNHHSWPCHCWGVMPSRGRTSTQNGNRTSLTIPRRQVESAPQFNYLIQRLQLPLTHRTLPSCSRTTCSSRADSSNCANSSPVRRSIFSSIGSPSSSSGGAPTYLPGVSA